MSLSRGIIEAVFDPRLGADGLHAGLKNQEQEG